MKTIILHVLPSLNANLRHPMNHPPSPHGLFFVLPVIACFALLPIAQADPAPNPPAPGVLNTRDGQSAMPFVTAGVANSAFGAFSLFSNTTGNNNTAVGVAALDLNNGDNNTAVGTAALLKNTANGSVAVGTSALFNNVDGAGNTAVGAFSAGANDSGDFNIALGNGALFGNTSGNNNIAIGFIAGGLITTANNVICIGAGGGNVSDSCFIGHIQDRPVGAGLNPHIVVVDDTGKLGTAIVDGNGNKVEGLQPQAMLRKIEELQATVAQQQKGMEVLTAQLKDQAAQIQKVSAQIEVSKPAAQVVRSGQ
jgi:hypothetical protein